MITSIFSKSKPINLVIVGLFIVLVFVFTNYQVLFVDFGTTLKAISRLFLSVFFIFLLRFIIAKNKLAQSNGYAIMTFGLLIFMFPQVMKNSDLLLANAFILFALRRLLSLHSNIDVKKKLFDAGFWIALATLFYFWALLFFALVIVALIYHSQNDTKNVIAPFVGVATLFILLMVYNIVTYDVYIKPSNFGRYASLDFTAYNGKGNVLKLTVLFTALVWTLIYFFKSLPNKNKKLRPAYFLVAWSTVLALLVAIIAPVKNGSEFIFLFAPFSIVMANYIEFITERWFKEVFIVLFIVTPLISLML
jgi:hypothetical protein